MAAQMIEQTAKKLKLHIMLSVAAMLGGLILLMIGASVAEGSPAGAGLIALPGLLLAIGGFIWWIIARTTAWWHHG